MAVGRDVLSRVVSCHLLSVAQERRPRGDISLDFPGDLNETVPGNRLARGGSAGRGVEVARNASDRQLLFWLRLPILA